MPDYIDMTTQESFNRSMDSFLGAFLESCGRTYTHVRCLRCKRVQPTREDLDYKCETCGHDTGELFDAPEYATPNQKLIRDALALSSGTLAGLIDCPRYEVIDTIQREFVLFCARHPEMETWQQAWTGFVVCAR